MRLSNSPEAFLLASSTGGALVAGAAHPLGASSLVGSSSGSSIAMLSHQEMINALIRSVRDPNYEFKLIYYGDAHKNLPSYQYIIEKNDFFEKIESASGRGDINSIATITKFFECWCDKETGLRVVKHKYAVFQTSDDDWFSLDKYDIGIYMRRHETKESAFNTRPFQEAGNDRDNIEKKRGCRVHVRFHDGASWRAREGGWKTVWCS